MSDEFSKGKVLYTVTGTGRVRRGTLRFKLVNLSVCCVFSIGLFSQREFRISDSLFICEPRFLYRLFSFRLILFQHLGCNLCRSVTVETTITQGLQTNFDV